MKIAYVNFVNHCYVDTEVEMKEIYTSNHIWKLFENFLVDMARVSFYDPFMIAYATLEAGGGGVWHFCLNLNFICSFKEVIRISDVMKNHIQHSSYF